MWKHRDSLLAMKRENQFYVCAESDRKWSEVKVWRISVLKQNSCWWFVHAVDGETERDLDVGGEEVKQTEEGWGVSAASCRSLQAVTDSLRSPFLLRVHSFIMWDQKLSSVKYFWLDFENSLFSDLRIFIFILKKTCEAISLVHTQLFSPQTSVDVDVWQVW